MKQRIEKTTQKINKTNSQCFAKIKLTNLQLYRPKGKKKRKKIQITKIQNENGDITTNLAQIKRIIRENYEQQYTNEKITQIKMQTLLETQNLPRRNQKKQEI